MRRLAALLTTVALTAFLATVQGPAAMAATSTANTLLARVTMASESGGTTYERSYFKHWTDANGDCQHARTEVLIVESKVAPTYSTSSHCTVTKGKWYSYYDGTYWTNPSDVDIDHMVALKEAWESGARSWSSETRTRYANDLGDAASLVAVTDNVNQSKSDRDPAQWLPPRASVHCTYAIHWIKVKYRWRLTIDPAERSMLTSILSGSCGARTVTVPTRAI